MVDKRLFVQRELRFSDARILEWMCRRHILSQGCSGNSRRENCAVLPEKLLSQGRLTALLRDVGNGSLGIPRSGLLLFVHTVS